MTVYSVALAVPGSSGVAECGFHACLSSSAAQLQLQA